MKPIKHDYANKNLMPPSTPGRHEIDPMWVFTDGEQCVSCWQLTWRDRLRVFLYGRVWLSVLSGQTQPPVWVSVKRDVFKP